MSAVMQDNPFGSAKVAERQSTALVAIEQSRAVAEIQAAMTVAKGFPRDPLAAMDRILNACTRPSLAEQALYVYSRGGTEITGPSIRLAEALAQAWGNIKASVRELEQRDGMSTVQTIAWDLESGYQSDKIFQVRHWRDKKNGQGYQITDARDIYEMVANQGARRLRACILAVIPGDVVEAAVKQCDVTLKTKAEVTPERLKSLLEKFAEFGVTKEQIEKRIQRHIEAMTPAQMVDLGKKYNSLKDGMSTVADWFDPLVAEGEQASTSGSKLKEAVQRAQAQPPGAPPAPEGARQPVEITLATVKEYIAKATDREIGQLALDMAADLSPEDQAEAQKAFDQKYPPAKGK